MLLSLTGLLKLLRQSNSLLFQSNGFNSFTLTLTLTYIFQTISLLGMLTDTSPVTLRMVTLWFLVVQAMLVPHCMWLFNRRYRSALGYIREWCACQGTFYTMGKKWMKI